ncbi:unnamed protein product [Clonostachys rhizophaga]|uniref:Uncharacterized protein n=1 Tax=Clonostachys rhizophaga TaxID=160324 RepID=A0A9N9YVE6_9HYPO|nr:unnamed protein product [Clonostachys rhizophaga]
MRLTHILLLALPVIASTLGDFEWDEEEEETVTLTFTSTSTKYVFVYRTDVINVHMTASFTTSIVPSQTAAASDSSATSASPSSAQPSLPKETVQDIYVDSDQIVLGRPSKQ